MNSQPITQDKVNISDQTSKEQMSGLEYQIGAKFLVSTPAQGSETIGNDQAYLKMRVNALQGLGKRKAGKLNKNVLFSQENNQINSEAFITKETRAKFHRLYHH